MDLVGSCTLAVRTNLSCAKVVKCKRPAGVVPEEDANPRNRRGYLLSMYGKSASNECGCSEMVPRLGTIAPVGIQGSLHPSSLSSGASSRSFISRIVFSDLQLPRLHQSAIAATPRDLRRRGITHRNARTVESAGNLRSYPRIFSKCEFQ